MHAPTPTSSAVNFNMREEKKKDLGGFVGLSKSLDTIFLGGFNILVLFPLGHSQQPPYHVLDTLKQDSRGVEKTDRPCRYSHGVDWSGDNRK